MFDQVDHFERGVGGVGTLVPALGAGPLDGLLDVVAREHAEDARYAGREADVGDALGHLGRDVLVMVRSASDDRAQADHGGVAAAGGQLLGQHRNFKAARRPDQFDVVLGHAVTLQGVGASAQELAGDELVESADEDRELRVGRCNQLALVFFHSSFLDKRRSQYSAPGGN